MSKKNKDPWYRQCTYELKLEDGAVVVGTSWIPENHAKVGHWIRLSKHHKYPDKSWQVTHVGGRRRESYLSEREMDYKHQREMSDV